MDVAWCVVRWSRFDLSLLGGQMFTFLGSTWGALFTNLLSDWASNYPGSWRKGWGGGSARIKTYPHMPGSNSTDAFGAIAHAVCSSLPHANYRMPVYRWPGLRPRFLWHLVHTADRLEEQHRRRSRCAFP